MKFIRVLLLLCFTIATVSLRAQQARIDIQGADTLILLGQRLAQFYQSKQPTVSVRVHGGGIKTAVPRLLKDEIQIGQTHGEYAAEGAREMISVPVGLEGIVFYVHESNPISEMTVAQVRAIYLGEITNWKQLGGPDRRITLFAGESSTGVIPYFQESVLQGAEPFGFWGKNSTKELLDTIAATPEGMGFASIGAAAHVKALRIRPTANAIAVEPTIANIRSRRYPVSRYIYWYVAKRPVGRVREFCEWVFSPPGQLAVESAGFQPLGGDERSAALRKLGIATP